MDKIGLIAGGGSLPAIIAKEARKNGYEVYTVGFEGFTSDELKSVSSVCEFFKLGKIQAPIDFFKKNFVEKVILIGNISHVNIFKDLKPDIRAASLLFSLKDKSPMGIFKALSKELEKDGITAADTSMFLKGSLASSGLLAGEKVSNEVYNDLIYGMDVARKIADMDIGLSVAVKDKAVLAVEAIEGTDACIKRAGELLSLSNKKGFALSKSARASQDMRFDLPVIGVKTIENMFNAGGRAIAVEAEKTLIIEKEKTFKLAVEKNISIIGVKRIGQ